MADLENMLLEAAGRTSSPVRKRHKLPKSRLKRDGSYSDGGTESRDEDSDDDDDHDDGATKKPSRSQSHVPLKKRLDPTKRTNDDNASASAHDDGDSSDESDIGSDLYKNEDDKQRLAKMTELEREMILSDRAAKKGEKEFQEKMRLKKRDTIVIPKSNNNNQSIRRSDQAPSSSSSVPPNSAKVRSSARNAERTASKGDALSELRAKRMKQQNVETTNPKPSKPKSSINKGIPSVKRKPASPTSSSSQSESGMRSDSDRESSDHNGLADSDDDDDDRNITGSDVPTFDEIKEITIRRSKLVKWLIEPFFDDLIVGCFVRIGIGKSYRGPVYRLCMVQTVDGSNNSQQYKVENRVTHKRLICVWGSENSAARFPVTVVSDSSASEKEYKQWVREMERTCSQMPSKQEVAGKRDAIRKTNDYIYSAATVKQMLEEKKTKPLNIAVEKDRLKNQLEVAKCNEDEEEMKRIYRRLQELEATRQARDNDDRAKRLAEMNKKNRVENFKNLSELKRISGTLKAGEDGYDPFSRRWTRSRNYFQADHGGKEGEEEKEGRKGDDGDGDGKKELGEEGVSVKVGVKATEEALEAAANAGKLIDTAAPVDDGTETSRLHDFELPISLAALQKYGGPQGLRNGFLARKQKLEATVGCQVAETDGSRHALTLTISDYKRRRGLL